MRAFCFQGVGGGAELAIKGRYVFSIFIGRFHPCWILGVFVIGSTGCPNEKAGESATCKTDRGGEIEHGKETWPVPESSKADWSYVRGEESEASREEGCSSAFVSFSYLSGA